MAEEMYLNEYGKIVPYDYHTALQIETDPELIKVRNTAFVMGFLFGSIVGFLLLRNK